MDNFKAKSVHESIEYLSYMLDTNKKVFYSRFGDGCLCALVLQRGARHAASPELAAEMKESFLIEDELFIKAASVGYPFEKGMAPGMFIEGSVGGGSYSDGLKGKALKVTSERSFYNPIVFHYLSVFDPATLKFFINNYIKPKKKMFIGSNSKKSMETLYGKIDFYIQTPEKEAYYSIDEWWPKVVKDVDKCEVVLPSAGAASRIMSKRLWEHGSEIHCIDIGSLNDAISGKASRTWIKMVGVNKIIGNLI